MNIGGRRKSLIGLFLGTFIEDLPPQKTTKECLGLELSGRRTVA